MFCCLLCFLVRKAFEFLFNDFHDLIWNHLQKITLRAIFSNLPVWSYSIITIPLVFSPVFLPCICPIFLVFRQNWIYSCLSTLWSQSDSFPAEFSQHCSVGVCAPQLLWFPGASAILTLWWQKQQIIHLYIYITALPVSFPWMCRITIMLYISWFATELIHVKFELSEIFEITISFFIPTTAYHGNAQN